MPAREPRLVLNDSAKVFGGVGKADFTLERTLALAGETHHVQGIELDGERIWVTSVDAPRRKGYLLEFSLADGKLLRKVEISEGEKFHPGAIFMFGTGRGVNCAKSTIRRKTIIRI